MHRLHLFKKRCRSLQYQCSKLKSSSYAHSAKGQQRNPSTSAGHGARVPIVPQVWWWLFSSCSIVRCHVIFGHPLFLFLFGIQCRAVLMMEPSSLRSTWPIHRQRIFMIVVAMSGPSNSWLSDVLREHWTKLRAAERKWCKSKDLSDLSKYQSLLSSFSPEVHTVKSSYFHSKINSTPDTRTLFRIFHSLLCPPPPPPTTSTIADDFATFFTENNQ